MKVIFDVNHAAHVHFVKNAYDKLTKSGHSCLIVASDKPLVYKLLGEYGLEYHAMGTIGKSLFAKLIKLIIHDFKLLLFCLKHRPQVILGIVSIRGSHVSWLTRARSIVFTDSEHASMQIALFKPFATEIHTPEWFSKDLGVKQRRYKGFHEMAYLHPNHFKPRIDVYDKLGISENDKFFIVRFVAWDATHDINQAGFSIEGKRSMIKELSKHGKVFISSEYELENEFKKYEYNLPSSYLHDALYYADIVIGEGATTACEAALLGIPSIYVNSIGLGYISYLEKDFDLVYHYVEESGALVKLSEILANENRKKEWAEKKAKFIQEQVDTTEYIVSLIEQNKS